MTPATPSQIRRPRIVSHTIDFGDGVTVQFTYDRNKLTDAWMQEWIRLENEQATPRMNEMLDDLISGWDIVGDDGNPYPKNAETIGFLFALPDKGRIFQELIEASVPSSAEGNASSVPGSTPPGGSTQPAATSLNGPAASPSPTPSESLSPR